MINRCTCANLWQAKKEKKKQEIALLRHHKLNQVLALFSTAWIQKFKLDVASAKKCVTQRNSNYPTCNESPALPVMAISRFPNFHAAKNPSDFRKQKLHIKFNISFYYTLIFILTLLSLWLLILFRTFCQ